MVKKKRMVIFLNPGLLISGIILSIIFLAVSCMFIIFLENDFIKSADIGDKRFAQIFFGILGIIGEFACFFCFPQWASYITIDSIKQTIEFKTWFRKPMVKNVLEYKYIYEADYWHGSVIPTFGFSPKYIVLSTTKIDKKYLTHINQLHVSEDVLIIKFTPKRWDIIQKLFNSNNFQNN